MARKNRTIKEYCNSNPIPRHHQKAGEKVATSSPPISAGWAWNPDEQTRKALSRGTRKIRKAKAAEREKLMEGKNPMATSKKKGTKKVSKKTTAKKTTAKKVSKKVDSKLISLKAICSELRVDTRLARRKLRAADLKGHDTQSRWEFTAVQAKQARKVLAA